MIMDMNKTNGNRSNFIHQIAPKDMNLWHPFWKSCHKSWIDSQNAEEKAEAKAEAKAEQRRHCLWNDREELEALIKSNYPQHYNLFMLFPYDIMRIDFARLAILHSYGGLYADMDVYCYSPFSFDNFPNNSLLMVHELTDEYTSASYENCLFGSTEKHNPFFLMTMDYVKMLFINSRNKFDKPKNSSKMGWRSVNNDYLINNITGSGMISAAIESFRPNFHILKSSVYNNRPGSYAPFFKTKHVHTSLWGNEYLSLKDINNKILIYNGIMYSVSDEIEFVRKLEHKSNHLYFMNIEEFDFHRDYCNGYFLNESETNVNEIKEYIKRSEKEIGEIINHER
jgi:hypothetical protein